MRRSPRPSLPVLGVAFALASLLARGAAGGEVSANGRAFSLPDGFSIERVAGPPLVDRPIVADFDELGRLYVADSSGSNDPVEKQLAERPHRIVRLEDGDGDGIFERRTVFADRMMLPEGAMWLDGSLYVSAPPSIWKLTDTDGDGVADLRSEWHRGKTLSGCANDLHGPYAGPDGRIYWAKGGFAEQTYDRPGRPPLVSRASHLLRCRADGSGLEPVMTGGMDNPVDVVFTPGGERIFSCTFFQDPAGGRRDGLIHAVHGAVYGKVHDVIDGHPRTGPGVMPVLAHLGPAAPCGLAAYESDAFGSGFVANLFTCCFNLRKVTRSTLTPDGATFASREEDFLSSPDRDFHPTDVVEDADGSLLVVDTGGWYKLCCPTSQLEKPDVLGAIYRIRRTGAPKVDDPRGLRLDWEHPAADALARLLGDARPAVRRRAIAALARRGEAAIPAVARAIRAGGTPEARRNAVWAATRIDGPEGRAAARPGLDDPDATVRQVALHSASLWRDSGALPRLVGALRDPSAQNRRVAAEAIGRLGAASAIPALFEAIGATDDPTLDHALTYALIEIDAPEATARGLDSGDARVRRAALVALDQAGGRSLRPGAVADLLGSADPRLGEAASWIVGRHPEWGGALAESYGRRLAEAGRPPLDREVLAAQLARSAASPAIRDLLAARLLDASGPVEPRLVALRALALSGATDPPAGWVDGLARILAGDDEGLVAPAVAATRALGLNRDRAAGLVAPLLRIAGQEARPDALRLDALAALPGGLAAPTPGLFAFLESQLDPARPVPARTSAAAVLAASQLDPAQLARLAEAVGSAGPMEVNRLLPAFEGTTDDRVGLALVGALRRSAAAATLRPEVLRPLFARFGPEVRRRGDELCLSLNADAATQRAGLERALGDLVPGDIRRGQAVFNGPRAACSSCHAIGFLGGKVGPDLSRVGQIRAERDLLEAILYPSASFVRSYEPVVVATRQGKVYNGVLRKDSAAEVVLATGAGEEARIPRDEIDEIRPGTVSVMPAGLDGQLTRQELSDLVAFLKACR